MFAGVTAGIKNRIRLLSPWTELAIVIAVCFGLFTARAIMSLVRGTVPHYTTANTTRLLVFEVGISAIIGGFLLLRGWKWRDFRIRLSLSNFIIGVLLALGYVGFVAFLYVVVFSLFQTRLAAPVSAPRFAVTWPLLAAFLVVNSLFEEMFATGYVVQALERQSVRHAILWSAGVRAMYHVYQGPLAALIVFSLGVVFATIFVRSRNLGIPVLAHTAINAILIAVFHRGGT